MASAVEDAEMPADSVATLVVAAFHAAFAAYLLGADTLAERAWLGGLDNYAEEVDTTGGAIAAIIVLLLGAVIVTGCVLRPVAPLSGFRSNSTRRRSRPGRGMPCAPRGPVCWRPSGRGAHCVGG